MTSPVAATPRLDNALTLRSGGTLPNRLMKSALSESLGTAAGAPTLRLDRLYARWAHGGYGLVVTGNVMVDHRQLGEPGNVIVEDERHLPALRRWAATFERSPSLLWAQINHPGRQANPLVARNRPVAPTAIAAKIPGMATPRALEDAEIRELIERYATTAAVLEQAGFDGVQIHGAHGYLVTQFLSPLSNLRDDEWGGDAERRRRFVLEILAAIRARTSPGFGVGIKLNSADVQRGGFEPGEADDLVRALVAGGIDLIEVSGGTYEAPEMMGTFRASTAAREAYFLEFAQQVREAAAGVPIAVTGGFRSRAAMDGALAAGECDVIGLGRGACTTPDAGAQLLGGAERVDVHSVRFGARRLVGRAIDLRTADGALDMQWHTDQLHRLGAGHEPDLARPWWRTVGAMLVRNGWGSLKPKRS